MKKQNSELWKNGGGFIGIGVAVITNNPDDGKINIGSSLNR